jgi:hypothetical protein
MMTLDKLLVATGIGIIFAVAPSEAQTPSKEQACRSVATTANGVPTSRIMCRGSDGQWREPASTVAAGPLAPGFRGKIVYTGTVNGNNFGSNRTTRSPVDLGSVLSRRPSVGSVFDLGKRIARSGGGASQGKPYQETITISLEYDGNLVTGTYEAKGTAGSGAGQLSGVRENGICKLFNKSNDSFTGRCDAASFVGTNESASDRRTHSRGEISASAVSVVDYAERDRLAAIARAQAEAKEKAARAVELAERAKMRAKLPKGAAARYSPLIDRAVQQDSQAWAFNRYRPGSIDLVSLKQDAKSGSMFTKAYFRYTTGTEGWVGAVIKGTSIVCLVFWDEGGCRPIGKGQNASVARGVVAGVFSGGPGNADSGRYGPGKPFANEGDEYVVQRQIEESQSPK